MAYTAIYRKWRPQTFDEVYGQQAIVKTLKHQVMSGRITHAYLFCGSRGTGKTSTAKILARAVNCLAPVDGNPCGKCEVCVKLADEANMDVVEIDAASNNGVDEIRDLRDKVKYLPSIGRYRVYIIDEVHMLSVGAFNALLKTLEEPPEHIIFILATTEPQRLPATVLSRCQRYDFKRLGEGDIIRRMRVILDDMNVQAEEEALQLIARSAQGAMRDALSILDRAVSFCEGSITYAQIVDMLGTVSARFMADMVDAVIAGDDARALALIAEVVEDGRDLSAFIRDMLAYLRDMMIVKSCQKPESLIMAAGYQLDVYKRQSASVDEHMLLVYMDILATVENQMRFTTQPRIAIEMAMLKLCHLSADNSMEAILARLKALENKVDGLLNKIANLHDLPPARKSASRDASKPVDRERIAINKAPTLPKDVPPTADLKYSDDEMGKLRQAWPSVLQSIKKEKMALYTFLSKGTLVSLKDGQLTIAFPQGGSIFAAALEKDVNREAVEKTVADMTGLNVSIRCIIQQEQAQVEPKDDIVAKAKELFGEDKVEVIDDET